MIQMKKLFVVCISASLVPTFLVFSLHNLATKSFTASNHSSSATDSDIRTYHKPDDYPDFFKPNLTHVITPLDFKVLASNDSICSGSAPFLVVLVLTMHDHVDLRNSIRDTWGRAARTRMWANVSLGHDVRYIFLLGLHKRTETNNMLLEEAKKFGDILMFDFQESYYNLTYKVLLSLDWLTKHCSRVQYVMKIDEDTFIHLPRLLHKLEDPDWNSNICGFYAQEEEVLTSGKNKNDFSVYPFYHFPPHVKGNLYFMPFSIAAQLVNISRYFELNVIEDVHVTGILARVIGLGDRYKGFSSSEYSREKPAPLCDIISKSVASTHTSPLYYRQIWSEITNPKTCKSSWFNF